MMSHSHQSWLKQLHHWPALQQLGMQRFEQFTEKKDEPLVVEKDLVIAALAVSDFIYMRLMQNPAWHAALAATVNELADWLDEPYCWQAIERLDEKSARRWLREYRSQFMLRVAWLELSGQIEVTQSVQYLSEFAQLAINVALKWLVCHNQPLYGMPVDDHGQVQNLHVLAMGKLGGKELNFSSDIDLIFCYREQGYTKGGRRELPNQQYFIRLGQQLISFLSHPEMSGFVFRVDMRLRPFGEAGPLAVSYSALEDYYQNHGRDWERYAMVKAHCINDTVANQQLKQLLRPFVFRRYIDFSVVDALRRMKSLILSEVHRKQRWGDIKLGRGGIREIEFIVQAQQLIWGGRLPALQQTNLLKSLELLRSENIISQEHYQVLKDSYLFLRRIENYLQELDDQQTQLLPQDELNQTRLAWVMGQTDWSSAYQTIESVLADVSGCFDELFGHSLCELTPIDNRYEILWQASLDAHNSILTDELDVEMAASLVEFRTLANQRLIGEKGQVTLDRLMPRLIPMLLAYEHPQRLCQRVLHLLAQILSRSTYLQLLLENPGALKQLLKLCDASAMVAEQLSRYPLLLDELLDPQLLHRVCAENSYTQELDLYMLRIAADDLELQIDALRQFKQVQMLRIAAADIADMLSLMKVSDHLTVLAEALVAKVVNLAWQQMVERYGYPSGVSDDIQRGFAVVGYGKLGGIELSYSSDLDLVFIHNCETYEPTSGPKVIDSKQFYLRLAQRIMHLFQTRTRSGILYEVDMRLRPSGNAGLLVSSWSAFADYQRTQAWTWEHQALVRSRMLEGDDMLREHFIVLRQEVLSRRRDLSALAEQIKQMREKMRAHLDRSDAQHIDLKHSSGAMVDIEFIAQLLVLAYAHKVPELLRWPDNIRIFSAATDAEIITKEQSQLLCQSYIYLRRTGHHRVLDGQSTLVPRALLDENVSVSMHAVQQLFQTLLDALTQ
ncbi:bifunctional [glutamate--ammonia ligase]-adenylyl-L-tyrosine phosphorylase/[glutamate--ammonia-ligase] adenylyltransferase [Celerinatantimonas diazotrophica]|uniref:Bifunctional glutamine synthetase adenylyltransferase/adenylyl-removing enzyme n=1 Tax=Celerinatantimonas diazotrophica TaxID=412034 RepID=A0A4R1J8T5_9GAMM|nr:bifunctional [glutamate--ammonia ligase]-adenylyl-L-tyrosine phosphorylase/[glutamate--ammonia-ligase] adenylyltransferase [Celerinatantimonas diazotrophica]TCK47015.1 glutamate-ammonia-ligase adenylyltransferase [Celerinatantimonas diazotrophica]CAG9295783.1 Bifunctional glutamine synthetase adenylyltransferase/adenylyl-removing enzyme [Celerinatantimonas diazotrophica]